MTVFMMRLIDLSRSKFINRPHSVTADCDKPLSQCSITSMKKQTLCFQSVSTHKGQLEWVTKFPACSACFGPWLKITTNKTNKQTQMSCNSAAV